MIYNGEEEELTLRAEIVVEKIRKELKQYINYNNDKKMKTSKVGPIKGFSNLDLGFSVDNKDCQLGPQTSQDGQE